MSGSGDPSGAAKSTDHLSPMERKRSARRALAARSGDEALNKQRLHERFKVPNARVVCQRKGLIGLWKPGGPPCIVRDMGIGGVSFFTACRNLKPGHRVRLSIEVPDRRAVQLKGNIVHVAPHESHAHICGVAFTDYGASAWATLCDLYDMHGGAAAEKAAAASAIN